MPDDGRPERSATAAAGVGSGLTIGSAEAGLAVSLNFDRARRGLSGRLCRSRPFSRCGYDLKNARAAGHDISRLVAGSRVSLERR
jgi:hypothetical protein